MSHRTPTYLDALRRHWPEYALEACELGLFMVSACLFAVILNHPSSLAAQAIESPWIRRGLMGLAMGLTAIAIIFSPMGQRSGAHMNPAVTLTFWRLGKVETPDAIFYALAQFIGGMTGVMLMRLALGDLVAHASVNHVATLPGDWGLGPAWLGEFAIALLLMFVVLVVSNRASIARYTGLLAGMLVAVYITFESPISGMSMNPARTVGSGFWAQIWTGAWIYFTAPPLAMLVASEAYVRTFGRGRVYCAKLHHFNATRCIFRCRFLEMSVEPGQRTPRVDAPRQFAAVLPHMHDPALPQVATVPPSTMNEVLYYG